MAKSRNTRTPRNGQRQPVKAKPSPNGRTVKELAAEAVRELPAAQRTAPVEATPDTVAEAELLSAWKDMERVRAAAEQAVEQAEAAEREAQRRAQELAQKIEALEQRERSLGKRAEELDAAEQAASRSEESLRAREQTLAERDQALATSELELDERHGELASQQQSLAREQAEQRRQRAELTNEQQLLADDRELLDEQLDRRTAKRHEWFEASVEALEQRLAQAHEERDRVDARLRTAEERERAIGGRSAEEVLAELDALREERRALRDELATRPTAEQTSRVEELARANTALRDELATVRHERQTLEIERDQLRTLAVEQRLSQDRVDALEATLDGYRAALEEEKQHFADLVARQEAAPPFALMSAMDTNPELTEAPAAWTRPQSLEQFVQDVRKRIAAQTLEGNRHLYYAVRDLRLFVAGLASSQLQILQGLSGTGKTSLPIAVAEAIHGGSTVVEVQAGWRDRQDLLGHYNTFERRYDETPFVQALYRAQCPAYADRPYFVVLDEMNLSHPEQYFTHLLSSITRDRQEIELTNLPLPSAPTRLDGGRTLTIPPNVWFVGTANHDETTKEFADKTYDRAHVQELSNHPEPFEAGRLEPWEPVSFAALKELFDRAAQDHAAQAQAACAYLHDELEPILTQEFGVGWGNRLDPQLARFVPAVIAAGGDLGEALDHVLATKILRKVRDRHDITFKALSELHEQIETSWGKLETQTSPAVSLEIVERERERMSGGR